MNPTRIAVLLAVTLAGCTTRNQSSYLEVLRVAPGVYTPASGATPASCLLNAGPEVDFLNIDLNKRFGQIGVVVANNLVPNAVTTSNRLNTNDFVAEKSVLTYEVIGGGTAPGQQISAAQGVVPAATTGNVATFFFPQGANLGAAIGPGKTVRVTFHIEGKLNDGSSVRTNEYEYVFLTCVDPKGGDCSSNQCL